VTRRTFIKRSGGATVATMVAWQAAANRAYAQGHDPASCSHKVMVSPAGVDIQTSPIEYRGASVFATYTSTPASGSSKGGASVSCKAGATGAGTSSLSPECELSGSLDSTCNFSGGISSTYEVLELSDLQLASTDYLWKYYAVIDFHSQINTGSTDDIRYAGTLSIREVEYQWNWTLGVYEPKGSKEVGPETRNLGMQAKKS